MTLVTIAKDVLIEYGYTEIVDQNERGEVTLRHNDGSLEAFVVCTERYDFDSWSLPTEDGRVLEFCGSI